MEKEGKWGKEWRGGWRKIGKDRERRNGRITGETGSDEKQMRTRKGKRTKEVKRDLFC